MGKFIVKYVSGVNFRVGPHVDRASAPRRRRQPLVASTRSPQGGHCLLLSLKACQSNRLQVLRRSLSLLRQNISGPQRE
jgi:hypothetical protein